MKTVTGGAIVLLVAYSTMNPSLADDEVDVEPVIESCVSTMILRNPEIIDDNTIVFHASRKRMYLNELPSTCRGLKRQGRITYTKDSKLCANDWFNILERSGTKLALGISCRLGEFQLIGEEELEELRDPTPALPDPQPVEHPEIEDLSQVESED